LLELLIALFAVLGFVYVPLGKKTGFQHVKAIVLTPPAKEAGRELFDVGTKLRSRVVDSVTGKDAGPPNAAEAPPTEPLMCVEQTVVSESAPPDASAPTTTVQ
jgi:hypothetical protein